MCVVHGKVIVILTTLSVITGETKPTNKVTGKTIQFEMGEKLQFRVRVQFMYQAIKEILLSRILML